MSFPDPSHLPTPQSPNARAPFIPRPNRSPSVTDSSINVLMMTQTIKYEQQHVHSFMTPESSPLPSGRGISPLPRRTTTPSSPSRTTSPQKLRSVASSPTSTHQTVPQSRLSSPFVEREPTEDLTPTEITAPQKTISSPPSSVPSFNLVPVNDSFSRYSPQNQAPLVVPSPLPAPNNELNLLVDTNLSKIEQSGLSQSECSQRSRQTPSLLANPSTPNSTFSHPPVSLDVTETPARGRRLKLFQETSEESFEESLMIHGYAHRSGVSHNGQLSQTTLDWLRHPIFSTSTACRPHSTTAPLIPPPNGNAGTENEARKRKRLESFLSSAPRSSKLRIVDVEGRGRILLGVEEETNVRNAPENGNTAQQKRPIGKRKVKGNGKMSPSKRDLAVPLNAPTDIKSVGPDWLDAEFPWSLKTDQLIRVHWETQAEKMRWIEKFLNRDSDSESEGEEIMPSSAWGELYQHPPMPCRRGRGKMVPIKAIDRQRSGTMVFPSDPADARAALLSRRAVRALSLRHISQARHSNFSRDDSGSGEDDYSCICEGKVEDRGLVQCDDCERWYHLQCIGVRNIKELGEPNDPWYCTSCAKDARRTVTPEPIIPSSEPTIVPTDDDCPGSSPKDPLFFARDSERSPFTTWRTHARPSTPTRGGVAFEPLSGSSSTAYSIKGGPSTPQTSSKTLARIYETPNLSINTAGAEPTFDLTTTPSRGMKFSAFTPKSIGPWSYNPRVNATGYPLHTPSKKHTGSFNRTLGRTDSISAFAPRQVQDSPTRRKEGAISRVLNSRRLYDTPMGPGGIPGGERFGGLSMLEESPVVRSAGKKRMREEVDMGDGVSAEE